MGVCAVARGGEGDLGRLAVWLGWVGLVYEVRRGGCLGGVGWVELIVIIIMGGGGYFWGALGFLVCGGRVW